MKINFTLLVRALFFIFPVANSLFALDKQEISQGREFWFGLPYVANSKNEVNNWISPVTINITSKYHTYAIIEDFRTGKTTGWEIMPGFAQAINFNDSSMNVESEKASNYGFHITSGSPVSVSVMLSYQLSSEAFTLIPAPCLGTEYYTLNLYQDKTDTYKPSEILIIATRDSTLVTYEPAASTEKVQKGLSKTVILHRGQTYLIKALKQSGENQKSATDLTGTHIQSDKPIAVISGHSKGAFPRLPATYENEPLDELRTHLLEMMPPVEYLGTTYVTAPLVYDLEGTGHVKDDKGDMLRFVAAADDAVISKLSSDGKQFETISPRLRKGEWFEITSQEEAALFKSTRPVLVGQYSKAGAVSPLSKTHNGKNEDNVQDYPYARQGFLITLPCVERWASFATFRNFDIDDNRLYITFKYNERDYLALDSIPFSTAFGDSIKQIKGTPYAYVMHKMRGDPSSYKPHAIEGRLLPDGKTKAKFFACNYGYNWMDINRFGPMTFGYPLAMNYATACNDSLYFSYSGKDSIITGEVRAVALDSSSRDCAMIHDIHIVDAYNFPYKINSNFMPGHVNTVPFTLSVIDTRYPARAIISAMTNSGIVLYDTLTYNKEVINYQISDSTFYLTDRNNKECKKLKIWSTGSIPANIQSFILDDTTHFSLVGPKLPLSLAVGDTIVYDVCAHADTIDKSIFSTKLSIVHDNFTDFIATLGVYAFNTKGIVITPSPLDFDSVYVDTPKLKILTIKNNSNIDAIVTEINLSDTAHFYIKPPFYPARLMLKDSMNINLWARVSAYSPDTIKSDLTISVNNAINISADYKVNLSFIPAQPTGVAENDPLSHADALSLKCSPNPATDRITINIPGETGIPNPAIEIFDQSGNLVATATDRSNIDISALTSGVYYIRLNGKVQKIVKLK